MSDFQALRSAIYTSPHRIVFFALDLLNLGGQCTVWINKL